jgi:glycosyltransferase involved in cell wall biosynthesis
MPDNTRVGAAMKPRVLMIAYACDPRGGGEHWLGWGWAEQASHSFRVDLVTTPKARAAVEESSRALGITPHFVDVPAWLKPAADLGWAGWTRKLAWQKRVARLARELHQREPIALVHQTTFHTYRVPFLAAELGIPSVWGPIAGGEHVPRGFERYLGRARWAEKGRNLANRFWLQAPSVKRSLRQASVLYVSNRTTLNFLPAGCHPKCRIVSPNALRPDDERQVRPPPAASAEGPAFRLLYVGNCVATRAIPLVLEALQQSGLPDYELVVVGGGPALSDWKQRAAVLGLGEKVRFVGKVPYSQVQGYYATADALVFPALRDSGGSALLEAMARYVPVICLDWGGPGEMLDEQSGIKVPVTTPEATSRAFAAALARLHREPPLRAALAQAARARADALFRWEAKRQTLEATYRALIPQ